MGHIILKAFEIVIAVGGLTLLYTKGMAFFCSIELTRSK